MRQTKTDKNKRAKNFLHIKTESKSHRRVTGKEGKAVWEHHNGMMCWTAAGSCGCLWVILCVCNCKLCVCACVCACGICGFLHPCVCLCERTRSRGCNHSTDALGLWHSFTFSWLSFYWTINRWRWRSRENKLLQCWSPTDQTSTPSITPILATCGCLLTVLYDVVSLALDEECRGL